MMNPASNTETLAPPGINPQENRSFVDPSRGQPASYLPSSTAPEASSWATHRADNCSGQNMPPSSSPYNFEQPSQAPTGEALNGVVVASSSSLGSTVVSQDYNGYTTYPNSTDSYGYGTTGYASYYNSYQQQTNQQYSQPIGGAYTNTGPYQPLSSFQNTGSYAVPASYSSTYYNPGDYQTSGGYPTSNYGNQTTQWNGGNYTNYSNYQYSSYPPSSTSPYGSVSAPAAPVHYQQQYSQYYGQTEVTCAPGTENMSHTTKNNVESPIPGVTAGYSTSIPPPPQTSVPSAPSWRPDASSSELSTQQPGRVVNAAHDGYWNQSAASFQNHHSGTGQPELYQPFDTKTAYGGFQDEQKNPCLQPQGPPMQYPPIHEVPQSHQFSQQTPSLDTRRVGKLQIQTNPRIVSNLGLGLGLAKSDKPSSVTSATVKPAYISVTLPKPSDQSSSNDASDSTLKSGAFPKSLRGYVERALARCKDEAQLDACQAVMKEMITRATADGTLHTRDWDVEPLFPLPDANGVNKDLQLPTPGSTYKRSPSRRTKSRWEPLPEEKPLDKPAVMGNESVKYSGWEHLKERDKKPFSINSQSKEDRVNSVKFSLGEQNIANFQRPPKRQRLTDKTKNAADNGDGSSDSDKEQSLSSYYTGAISLATTPEERKRRENRSRRFEKGHGNRAETNHYKPKIAGAANLYTRRATALVISKTFDNVGSEAVEDIDWDSLTVKGTCQEIEKRYLRLTSAPDPSTVRPEEVLEKALIMVQDSDKNYFYKCDQLKSIRQDLTVQRIRNQLTAKVYETHARLALEVGDLPEYNQCQSQLQTLYAEGIEGCCMEFSAYGLLCVIMHSNNNRDLLSLMSRLSRDAKEDEAVKHALAVRAAVTSGNYIMFFRLYKTAPNLNSCLMDPYVEKMRFKAVSCMSKSYRPTVPVSYIAQVLGFANPSISEGSDEKEQDGLEECVEWLKAHGAGLITDNNGEMQLDAKASSTSLYIPEPEDAVAHGDANLAVNDFLARATL